MISLINLLKTKSYHRKKSNFKNEVLVSLWFKKMVSDYNLLMRGSYSPMTGYFWFSHGS